MIDVCLEEWCSMVMDRIHARGMPPAIIALDLEILDPRGHSSRLSRAIMVPLA